MTTTRVIAAMAASATLPDYPDDRRQRGSIFQVTRGILSSFSLLSPCGEPDTLARRTRRSNGV